MWRRVGWAVYDHMGQLVLFNLLWAVLALPWLASAGLVISLGAGLEGELAAQGALAALMLAIQWVLLAPPGVFLHIVAMHWIAGRDLDFKAALVRAWRLAPRAQAIGLAFVAATLVLLVNLFFYQRLGGWLGLGLSGLMLWLLVALGAVAQYAFPVLVTQDTGVGRTLQQSLLLAADNAGASLRLLLVAAVGLGLCLVTMVGAFCGALALWALVQAALFTEVLGRYTGHQPTVPEARSWRQLVRPWEM